MKKWNDFVTPALTLRERNRVLLLLIALMLLIHGGSITLAKDNQSSAYAKLVKGEGWLHRGSQPKTPLKIGVKLPIQYDDIVQCGTKSTVDVDLGNGVFAVVKPCEFRIPNIAKSPSPTQQQIAAAMATGGRERNTPGPAWISPAPGTSISPKDLALAWTPFDGNQPITITLHSLRAGDLWEEDQIDPSSGKLNSILLNELLQREKLNGDSGPFTLTLNCDQLGSPKIAFMLR